MTDAELKRYKERMDLEKNARQAKADVLAANNRLKQEKRKEKDDRTTKGLFARLTKRITNFSTIIKSLNTINTNEKGAADLIAKGKNAYDTAKNKIKEPKNEKYEGNKEKDYIDIEVVEPKNNKKKKKK